MSAFEYHIDPAVAAFKTSIIPDVTEQLESIQRLLDGVILASGGESGRDFTPTEHKAFECLIEARNALWGVKNCANEEVI